MGRVKEYCVGDLVELKTYERQPRLRGIILERLGYDKNLDDLDEKIQQLGFEIILLCLVNSSTFTSGTTKGTSDCILK